MRLLLGIVALLMAALPAPGASRAERARAEEQEAAAAFALRLFQAAGATPGNVVLSPLGVSVLLALTRHGAGGDTQQQITSALRLSPDLQATAEGYAALLNSLQNTSQATLRSANKLYAQRSFRLKDAFRQVATGSFKADAEALDFVNDTEGARRAINQWVEDSTEGKIQDMFDLGSLTQSTRLVLVNAMYFKAGWRKPFEVSDTSTQPFHVSESTNVSVPTMHGNFQLQYGEIPQFDAKVVKLPYKAGREDLHMLILLPNSINGLQRLEEGLGNLDFRNLSDFSISEVQLSLPKFRLESKNLLKGILSQMGITELFGPGADLSGIADQGLYVDDVVQKVFVGTDEKGTEAAVATGINLHRLTIYQRVEFKVDRPFLFVIKKGDIFLFLGRVTNPNN